MAYLEILLIAALIVLNGALAMSELAIVSSRKARLQSLVQQKVKGSRRAVALASDPGRFLSTVQIGITLVGILAGAVSGATIGRRFGDLLVSAGVAPSVGEPLGFAAVVVAITYVTLIVGELVPKQIALRNPEAVACRVAPAMTFLSKVGTPLVWLLDVSGKAVLALLGHSKAPAETVTDEEIRMLMAEAESSGLIEPEERHMIAGVMRLGDRLVSAVMTPRHDVDMIDIEGTPEDIARQFASSPYSRLPVYQRSSDEVVGVIQAKHVAEALLEGRTLDFANLVENAPIIPEVMEAIDAVEVLKSSVIHMGLVHDEYGQFLGVVTSADILEAIVGAFRTEEGPAELAAVQRDDGSYLISGTMLADEFAELLGIKLPPRHSYQTVAGFVLDQLGHLPSLGETFTTQEWKFEIVDLDGRRIDKLIAAREPSGRS
jgi:putative hemolysin